MRVTDPYEYTDAVVEALKEVLELPEDQQTERELDNRIFDNLKKKGW